MHTLAIGSTIAVLSAWTTAPTGGVFDSGLAGRFAAAFERHSDNCLAADLIVDGGGMLVMLNEHGDVTEVDLGSMPTAAARELRSVMPGRFVAAHTPMTPDALMCAAMGSAEEREVTVEVDVSSGDGTIVVNRDGEEREFEVDLDGRQFGELKIEMGGDGADLGDLFNKLMSGEGSPEIRADVIVAVEGEDGDRRERRINLLDGDADLGELMMMFMSDGHARGDGQGERHGHAIAGRGMSQCPHCPSGGSRGGHHGSHERGRRGLSGHPGMSHPGMGHPGMGGEHPMMSHGGMNWQMDEGMMRQHMRFLDELREDPHAVWGMIDGLPDDMREQHEVIMHALMRDGEPHHGHDQWDGDGFNREAEGFAVKIDMAREVADRLRDAQAMAIFGVWQVRERMEPAERISMLAPMIGDQSLMLSVRNAAAWVVMDAQNELDNRSGGAETLRQFIMTNGAM